VPLVCSLGHYVQQQHVDTGIGDLGGNTAAHHPGAENGNLADIRHYSPALSRMVAMPCPPPMHCVARAYRPPVRWSRLAALPVMRAPVAPSGWPRAMAPPSMLTFAMSTSRSSSTASDCAAKASLSSITS